MAISHEDIVARLAAGEQRFKSLEGSLGQVAGKLDHVLTLLEPLPEMKVSIDSTKDIVEAYTTVKNAGRFVKWLSGIAIALGGMYALVKGVAVSAVAELVK